MQTEVRRSELAANDHVSKYVLYYPDPAITMYYAPDGEDDYTKPEDGPLFLWGQSVFIIAQLLTSGLLHINELDTIRRYLPSYNRPRKGGRYSAFQVKTFYIFTNQSN